MNGALSIFICRLTAMSLLTLAYTAVLPLLSRRYMARHLSMAWMAIAVGWFFPFFVGISIPIVPTHVITDFNLVLYEGTHGGENLLKPAALLLGVIWLTGVIIAAIHHISKHCRFIRLIRRWNEAAAEPGIIDELNRAKKELGVNCRIALCKCPGITSPALVGVFRPKILIPPEFIADDESYLVFKHELYHLKRHDILYKLLLITARTLYWFDPITYLMTNKAELWCEIACDEAVLQGSDMEARKRYGEIIIMIARRSIAAGSAAAVSFYGGLQHMRTRLLSITNAGQKKIGASILCIILFSIVMTGVTVALPSDEGLSAEAFAQPSSGVSEGDSDYSGFDPEMKQLIVLLSGKVILGSESHGEATDGMPAPTAGSSQRNEVNNGSGAEVGQFLDLLR